MTSIVKSGFRPLPETNGLPYALYRAEQVRELDRISIESYAMSSRDLMERAGQFAFFQLQRAWPECRRLTVLCGAGNNGGDAYVVARLAAEAGFNVQLLPMVSSEQLKGDAKHHALLCEKQSIDLISGLTHAQDSGVIVDGLLGTGLDRQVEGRWAVLIQQVNRSRAPVLALDVPSGLNADTGSIMGEAIRAEVTTSFIGLKQGMFTSQGPACCGRIFFSGLEVPAQIYASQILSARRIDWRKQQLLLKPLSATVHKGSQGHVLVIGGEEGATGAVRLSAEVALRTGAGLVTVATRPSSTASIIAGRAEIMAHGIDDSDALRSLIDHASAIVIGPGLGKKAWAETMLESVLQSSLPLLIDADAINLIARQPLRHDNWILTPHPGEAARLLNCTVANVEHDRIAATKAIQKRYGGVVVLKGAGSIVFAGTDRPPAICSDGNPGMATAGMGDVLSGVIGALLAQGYQLQDAAEMGVALHAAAADEAATDGMRGMIASDLFPSIRRLLG